MFEINQPGDEENLPFAPQSCWNVIFQNWLEVYQKFWTSLFTNYIMFNFLNWT